MQCFIIAITPFTECFLTDKHYVKDLIFTSNLLRKYFPCFTGDKSEIQRSCNSPKVPQLVSVEPQIKSRSNSRIPALNCNTHCGMCSKRNVIILSHFVSRASFPVRFSKHSIWGPQFFQGPMKMFQSLLKSKEKVNF